MLLFRANMTIDIALTVVFVFASFGMIYRYGRKLNDRFAAEKNAKTMSAEPSEEGERIH